MYFLIPTKKYYKLWDFFWACISYSRGLCPF